MYSQYYQAKVIKKKTWFVSGVFRNENNIAFARALEGYKDVFEFFVPQDQEEYFLYVINYLKNTGYVLSFEKKPNRLITQDVR